MSGVKAPSSAYVMTPHEVQAYIAAHPSADAQTRELLVKHLNMFQALNPGYLKTAVSRARQAVAA